MRFPYRHKSSRAWAKHNKGLCLVLVAVLTLNVFGVRVAAQEEECTAADLRNKQVAIINCKGDPPEACSIGGDLTLSGSGNEEIIWNLFMSMGFQPHMAAGFMGNMHEEAHFEPRLVEYGWKNSRGEVSRAGKPSSLDDQIPPNQNSKGQPGYGLIQWTSPGRKAGLQAMADSMGLPPSDLRVQLSFMKQELEGPYKKSTLDPLMASKTVEEATEIITRNYEIPARMSSAIIRRQGHARGYLERFGSGTTSSTYTPAGTSSCGAGGESVVEGARYPLEQTKSAVESSLGGCLQKAQGKVCHGGHNYLSHDLFAPQGTNVLAFAEGEVIKASVGSCGHGFGQAFSVQVYNAAANVTYFYQHMDPSSGGVAVGKTVKPGELIGKVGPSSAACNTPPHLHIDANTGRGRPACSRKSCSSANKSRFIDISIQLFKTYMALP